MMLLVARKPVLVLALALVFVTVNLSATTALECEADGDLCLEAAAMSTWNLANLLSQTTSTGPSSKHVINACVGYLLQVSYRRDATTATDLRVTNLLVVESAKEPLPTQVKLAAGIQQKTSQGFDHDLGVNDFSSPKFNFDIRNPEAVSSVWDHVIVDSDERSVCNGDECQMLIPTNDWNPGFYDVLLCHSGFQQYSCPAMVTVKLHSPLLGAMLDENYQQCFQDYPFYLDFAITQRLRRVNFARKVRDDQMREKFKNLKQVQYRVISKKTNKRMPSALRSSFSKGMINASGTVGAAGVLALLKIFDPTDLNKAAILVETLRTGCEQLEQLPGGKDAVANAALKVWNSYRVEREKEHKYLGKVEKVVYDHYKDHPLQLYARITKGLEVSEFGLGAMKDVRDFTRNSMDRWKQKLVDCEDDPFLDAALEKGPMIEPHHREEMSNAIADSFQKIARDLEESVAEDRKKIFFDTRDDPSDLGSSDSLRSPF